MVKNKKFHKTFLKYDTVCFYLNQQNIMYNLQEACDSIDSLLSDKNL